MTYSIVARDSRTGELGVAVQSHWFSVGSVVGWAEAGVGAVATQAFAQPSYGPLGLTLLRAGIDPESALAALTHADPERERRQVAMVSAAGAVAAHTGSRCIAAAGHASADGVSVQANMMRSDRVWPAMLDAYHTSQGPFADRLLAALDAGEAAGGDIRGRQSAALLVVAETSSNQSWRDRLVDLRVEDSSDPLGELRRLLAVRRAYHHMEAAEEREVSGDIDGALEEYQAAQPLLGPGNDEAAFWVAVMLANNGRVEEAQAQLQEVAQRDPGWAELFRRLPGAGLLTASPDVISRIAPAPAAAPPPPPPAPPPVA
jgi:uncharacterized Ntn-hydrolase superfamily protein